MLSKFIQSLIGIQKIKAKNSVAHIAKPEVKVSRNVCIYSKLLQVYPLLEMGKKFNQDSFTLHKRAQSSPSATWWWEPKICIPAPRVPQSAVCIPITFHCSSSLIQAILQLFYTAVCHLKIQQAKTLWAESIINDSYTSAKCYVRQVILMFSWLKL